MTIDFTKFKPIERHRYTYRCDMCRRSEDYCVDLKPWMRNHHWDSFATVETPRGLRQCTGNLVLTHVDGEPVAPDADSASARSRRSEKAKLADNNPKENERTNMKEINRIAVHPLKMLALSLSAGVITGQQVVETLREHIKKPAPLNKPCGRGKETGDGGQHCSLFIATDRETGKPLTSYSEAIRRAQKENRTVTPNEETKQYVFFNLRAQNKGQSAGSVDEKTLNDVMADLDAASAVSEADVDAAVDESMDDPLADVAL